MQEVTRNSYSLYQRKTGSRIIYTDTSIIQMLIGLYEKNPR
jgi:hypothetical protein